MTPAGVGAALPVVLVTAGGSSPVDSSFLFSYAPPQLNSDPALLAVGNGTSPSALRQRLLQVRWMMGRGEDETRAPARAV